MKDLSATYKGLITGILMILISIGIYFYRGSFENKLQYITYFVYIAGIIWALIGYKQSDAESKTFKNYFAQGFRCFIVVTLMMVVFTWVFLMLNPALKEEMGKQYHNYLVKQANYTPAEIDTMVLNEKKYFIIRWTSTAIFGYLFIGSLVTLIAAAFLSQKK